MIALDSDIIERATQLLIAASSLVHEIEQLDDGDDEKFAENVSRLIVRVVSIYPTPGVLEGDLMIMSLAVALMREAGESSAEDFDA